MPLFYLEFSKCSYIRALAPACGALISSSEHAYDELLGYCDVYHTCGRSRHPRRPSINFLLVYTLEGTVLTGSTGNFGRTLIFIKSRPG